ncbi:TPA: hypothetical protein U6I48_000118 [Klebsiella aerogenes]|nr:hypothetical protein [Klebsiella aerogenes]
MSITYQDIQFQNQTIQRKYQERQALLREKAQKLVCEYIGSLSLPADSWLDRNGHKRSYVSVGELNAQGLFQKMPFAAFELNDSLALSFKISTIINDSHLDGGDYYLLSVSMWYESGRLHVQVGKDGKVIIVAAPDEDGAFYEVCSSLKQILMSGFVDPRLD